MVDGKGKALRALVLLNVVSKARLSFSECGTTLEPRSRDRLSAWRLASKERVTASKAAAEKPPMAEGAGAGPWSAERLVVATVLDVPLVEVLPGAASMEAPATGVDAVATPPVPASEIA
jgi:hypothetical protein